MIFENYDNVKDKLFLRLWNRDSFREYENRIPYRAFGDLIISCMIDVKELMGMPGTTHFTWRLANDFGITEGQLFEDAFASAPKLKPLRTETVREAIQRILGTVTEEPETPLSVITTEDGMYGASAVLYPGALAAASRGRNLFLIPSSIHEFLFLEDDGNQSQFWIEHVIRSVNEEEVAPDDLLSDHLYYYDAGRKTTSMIRPHAAV